MQSRQVPDVTRFDKTEDGQGVVWVGQSRVLIGSDPERVTMGRAELIGLVKQAQMIGWNAHAKHVQELMLQMTEGIVT